MFDGPEYESYIALMRELRLERESEFGDLWLDAEGGVRLDIGFRGEGGWLHAPGPMGDLEQRNGTCIWLPLLHQWLAMLIKEGWTYHLTGWTHNLTGQPPGYAIWVRRDGMHHREESRTPEEAAAQLWMAVTGKP